MASTAAKKQIDWESVSREYRAGVRSLRNIGEEFGITEGAIRKRAKAETWPRDLSEKIAARAADLVRIDMVRSGTQGEAERTVVEVVARNQADLILAHRKDITRFRNLAAALLTELEIQTKDPQLFAELGDILRNENERGVDRINDIYQRLISTPGRVDSVKKLAEVLKILIGLERQAFGMADNAEGDKPPAKTEKPIDDIAQRIAFILTQASKGK